MLLLAVHIRRCHPLTTLRWQHVEWGFLTDGIPLELLLYLSVSRSVSNSCLPTYVCALASTSTVRRGGQANSCPPKGLCQTHVSQLTCALASAMRRGGQTVFTHTTHVRQKVSVKLMPPNL